MTTLAHLSKRARLAAAETAFAAHFATVAPATEASHRDALKRFCAFTAEQGVKLDPVRMHTTPSLWQGVTGDLLSAFQGELMDAGYAPRTINRMVSHLRVYLRLCAQAGVISQDDYLRAQHAKAIRKRGAEQLRAARVAAGDAPRLGRAKEIHANITEAQAAVLLNDHPNTPRGRRNRLLMHLLLHHGLRESEAAALDWKDIGTDESVTVKRSKTLTASRIKMTPETAEAFEWHRMESFLETGEDVTKGAVLRGNVKRKPDELSARRMSRFAIYAEVRSLGRDAGIPNLSPHDCRVYWALWHWNKYRDLHKLMHDGGWSSPAMPLRYTERAEEAKGYKF